jgi:Flp pilus assembly pilin Flp
VLDHRFVIKLWRDRRGQDLVEYALMAALVAVGTGILMPPAIYPAYSTMWARITSVLAPLLGGS